MAIETVRLRAVRLEDARLLWEWSRDPEVLANAFDPIPPSWEAHQEWLAARWQDGRSWLTILESTDATPIGQCRFDVVPEGLEIDFSISAECRGRGYGVLLVTEAMSLASTRWPPETRVIARVLSANPRSIAVCQRAGFRITEYGNDHGRAYVRLDRRLSAGHV